MTATGVSRAPSRAGLTTIVAGIVAYLPSERIRAPSGAWHWAFMKLRDEHFAQFPELCELEFSRRANVWPVSEKLERIFQVIDMAGTGGTLNPTLVVRQFDRSQKRRLRKRLAGRLGDREGLISELGAELKELLTNVGPNSPS